MMSILIILRLSAITRGSSSLIRHGRLLSRYLLSYDIKSRIRSPHLLDVVESPYLGSEQVDNHVARVEHNPVRVGHTFEAHGDAAAFQSVSQFLGKGSHV